MKKGFLTILLIIALGVFFYGLTLRGVAGNPGPELFKDNLDIPTGPFELSPERGRYVHVVNLAERGRYDLTPAWRDVAYPDVGVWKGKFYSFFAPGVAYLTLPFYEIGSSIGYGQLFVFLASVFASIITLIFIYLIGRGVFKLTKFLALFAVLVFGFASTSWSYSITLYQHAFTTCLFITSFYAVWRYRQKTDLSFWYASYVWLAYALAIAVDYPNAILMLPIMVYLAFSTFSLLSQEGIVKISIRWVGIIASIFFIGVTCLHFWHNAHYFGSWRQLSGGVPTYHLSGLASSTVPVIATTTPTFGVARFSTTASTTATVVATSSSTTTGPSDGKNIAGFFREKHIPNGLYILLVSPERGLLFFSPIFILSILGIVGVFKKRKDDILSCLTIPFSLILINIILYSSWGDPWGGWAFGPRYLIPSLPWLALFVAVFLGDDGSKLWKKFTAYFLFLFSSAVALLGALTTNAVPPKAEALLLPVKKYTFLKNVDYLVGNQSSSFLYKTYLLKSLTLLDFFVILYIILGITAGLLIFYNHSINNHD